MTSFVALLRAVNVGGTGKVAMSDLRAWCESLGLQAVRTYIASGNVLFQSDWSEARVKAEIEATLHRHARRPIGIMVRTAPEMTDILTRNPFAAAPPNRVTAIFLDRLTSPETLHGTTGQAADEELHLGRREIYVHYRGDMARSKLRIPAALAGTARNMNTVAKLASLASTSS
jgi:uncharacterized protein (DUF1697 family)